MRGKRSKQYRKLMQQYGQSFGFREPYQVLLDADMIKDADRFKMDLLLGLERTLHGKVKPMITQCCMRHLYNASGEPGISYLIDKAKTYERRRCGHRPEEYPEPLSAKECLASVVDPKGSKRNKNCYVVASQELEVRKSMRSVLGVPLVYINRSVMIMEPMAGATAQNREKEESIKFRAGLKRGGGGLKRKRDDEQDEEDKGKDDSREDIPLKKKKSIKGVKGPNPLAVKKAKKKPGIEGPRSGLRNVPEVTDLGEQDGGEVATKRKRKRKPKASGDAGEDGGEGLVAMPEVAGDSV